MKQYGRIHSGFVVVQRKLDKPFESVMYRQGGTNEKKKNSYQAEEKVAILKRHLVDGESVSSICESLKLQPSQFYSWQKQFFENGASAFKQTPNKASCKTSEQKQIEQLESKLI